jgi:hypothetical protein
VGADLVEEDLVEEDLVAEDLVAEDLNIVEMYAVGETEYIIETKSITMAVAHDMLILLY